MSRTKEEIKESLKNNNADVDKIETFEKMLEVLIQIQKNTKKV